MIIYVGQAFLLSIDTKSDLSTATASQILTKDPDGNAGTLSPCTISGSLVNYGVTNEFNKCGKWKGQAKITFPGGISFSTIFDIDVQQPLATP